MKDRTWFNVKLYRDTLRELRVMGRAYLIVCLVVSWLLPIGSSFEEYPNPVTIEFFTPILYVLMTAGAVTLVYNAFSYLFSRRASDYFHALPTKRTGVCLSRFAAVMTWLWAIIAVTVVSTVVVNGLALGSWRWGYVFHLIRYYGVISLFFAASALCGVSLTGTRFAALVVTGLVAFMVRFLLLMLSVAIMRFAPVISTQDFGAFLNPYNNIATASVMLTGFGYMIGFADTTSLIVSFWPAAYTFVVGLAYTALGTFLYHRRMSETAQMSAPTPLMQAVYRCGITLPVLLPFIISMTLEYGSPIAAIAGTPSEMLSFIVASLIIYLGFEVITTKKLKALYKTLPAYAALFVFCLAFAFGARFIANQRSAILPEPAQIRGVMLTQENYLDYTDIVLDDVTVANEDVNAIVSTALKRCVGFGKDLFTRNTFAAEIQITVRIRLAGGGSLARVVLLTQNEYTELTEALMADAGYVAKLRQMPSGAQIESITDSGAKLTDAQAREVYGLLSDDLAKLSEGDFRLHVIRAIDSSYDRRSLTTPPSETMANEQFTRIDSVIVSGQVNYRRYTATYAISWLTPNALKRYVELVALNSNAFMTAHLPASLTDLNGVKLMSLTMYDLKTGRYVGSAADYSDGKQEALDDEKRLKLFALIRSAIGQPEGDYLLQITLEIEGAERSDNRPGMIGMTLAYLTQEQANALKALLEFR